MRVIKSFGCTSGRLSHSTNSFGSRSYAPLIDAEGHAQELTGGDDDTRLPSERSGAYRPLIFAPPVYPKPRRLTAGVVA